MSLKGFIAAFAALVPLAACSSGPKAIRYDDAMAGRNKRTEVEIAGSVVKACHLATNRAYFDYASDGLDDDDKAIVGEVAACMESGALRGRSILVTGYTDLTGTKPDNAALGLSRSEAIAAELHARGVPANRIFVRSRGEKDAKYIDADDMKYDRKVILTLVERDS
ncbi:MAG: OmpA family protein [Myxococcota bacterium]